MKKCGGSAGNGVGTILVAAILFLLFNSVVSAHDPKLVASTVTFSSDFTNYKVELHVDLDAMNIGFPLGHLNQFQYHQIWAVSDQDRVRQADDLKSLVKKRVYLRFDGQVVEPQVTLAQQGKTDRPEGKDGPYWGHLAILEGDVPLGAKEFTFTVSRALANVTLTTQIAGYEDRAVIEILPAGGDSKPFVLHQLPPPLSRLTVAGQYLVLGFEHILPKGLDHILFVLGLFLLSPRLKPLLLQVTAFTVAHTVTLALSMFGIVQLSSSIVEPLIALSIAYVAVENTLTPKLKPWRPAVVFLFGLLHGLGFAGVLTELGLPKSQYMTALVGFNVGVELGQLAVISLAFALTYWCQSRVWYRHRVVVPASIVIALVGVYWAVERTFG